jgi:DNA invertase Pin-like site-specific DNA recombinase
MQYGYARVSTEGQKLEPQIEVLRKAGARMIYSEKYTGTTMERPVFESLLQVVKPKDTIIITKLDRFARNTGEAIEVIHSLFSKNITVNILNLGIIDSTPTGQLIFTIFSVFAQFERDMIVTRMREGKNYARKHRENYKEGRPLTYSDEQVQEALQLKLKGMTYKQIQCITGISVSTQKRRLKKLRDQVKVAE